MNNSASDPIPDITIIGAGIVGLATARALQLKNPECSVTVMDKAPHPGAHQSGHNSGVIHSGIYYKPGSRKARFCREGKRMMIDFCARHSLPYEMCGKVIVATEKQQLAQLKRIYQRGLENRIEGLQIIDDEQLRQLEPNCRGVAAIKVGSAGITDFQQVAAKLAELIRQNGGSVVLNEEVLSIHQEGEEFRLATTSGTQMTRAIINCAGLQADRVARKAGFTPGVRVVPFRGEYYKLTAEAKALINNLIYPLPDENFPFLGVHCTRMVNGDVECGPNAVFAPAREGYSRWALHPVDMWDALTYSGFRKLAGRHWRMGWTEIKRSFSKARFAEAVRELVPEISKEHLIRATPGIRAIAVDPEGNMVDDFHFITGERQLHVLNAPSPAATASLKLGDEIAAKALEQFDVNAAAE